MSDAPEIEEPSPDGGLADHPLTAQRLAKHEATLSGEGYPYRFDRSDYASELHERYEDLEPGTETTHRGAVAGRLMAVRKMGKLMFAVLQDTTGRIQLFVDKRTLGDEAFDLFADLDIGDWVGGSGVIITTKKGEVSVRIDDFTLLARALRPLPDKWHGLQDVEARSRRRYVDLMVNDKAREVALVRAKIVSELRRQFEARGYVEVETPVLLNQATGGLASPFRTHHNALEQDMYLRIATELYLKRLVVGGMERVFEIGRIFRNEGVDSTHNPEFTMLESYEAFADYRDIMVMLEEMIRACALIAVGTTEITYQGRTLDLAQPFRRVRMVDLVAEATGESVDFDRPIDEMRDLARRHGIEPDAIWGHGKIIDQLFEALVADNLWEPTYVLDHPKEVSPLARQHRNDPNLTERYELFIAGAEYANAFSELNDPLDQRRRFEQQALARAAGDDEAHPVDEDFILALEYGLPPTGGLGIGVDRLVMLLTDQHHIREVILFPTLRPEG
ncbi:MAG: lysine--tRNA ligase [bacterium]|nr:lysine--tRNA ligase [bacterium]